MRGGNCRPAALGELNLAHHLPEEVRIRSFFRVLMTSDICNGLAEISAGRASLESSFIQARRCLDLAMASTPYRCHVWHKMHRPARKLPAHIFASMSGMLDLSRDVNVTCLAWTCAEQGMK